MPEFQLNIAALNAICIRMGGAGEHRLHIDALNEWATLAGDAGGHRRSVDALNAIAARLGGPGGHRFNLDALDEIAVRLGGAGGADQHLELLEEIAALVAAVPAAPAIQAVSFAPQPPRVGETVAAVVDRTGAPTPVLAHRWRLDGTDIPGATGPAYTVAAGDLGGALSVAVTASNAEGSADGESAAVEVLAAPGAPQSLAAPAIAGVPEVGTTLVAVSDGAWSGGPALARNWQRDGADIAGATGPSYVPAAGEAGCAIRLRVTASGVGGAATAWSAGLVVGAAADVFVDSDEGEDGNDGTSPAQAVRTLAEAAGLASGVGNGVVIRLKRGGVWDEELSLSQDGALVGAYGSTADPMPLVRCSDAVDPGDFAPAGGTANVYDLSVAHNHTTNNLFSPRVFEDGAQLEYVEDTGACDATPGSFTYDPEATDTSPVAVQIHPFGSTDPTADGKAYRVVTRDYAVQLTGDGGRIEGIHGTQNGNHGGSLVIRGSGGSVRDCLATWGSVHNLFVWGLGGASVRGTVAYRTRSPIGNSTSFVAYHDEAATAGSISWIDCWAHPMGADEVAAPGLATGANIGFYAHTSGGDATIPDQKALGCVARRSPTGLGAGSLSVSGLLHVQDCFFDHTRDAIGAGSNVIADNVVFVSDLAATGAAGEFIGGGTGAQIVRDARVCMVGAGLDIWADDGPSDALSVTDSILWTSRTAIPADPSVCVVNGTVVRARDFYDRDSAALDRADGNVFVTGVASASYRVNGVDHATLAGYRAAHPTLEAGSTETASAGGLTEAGMLANDWQNSLGAGSGKTLLTPPWQQLLDRWEAGFLGIDELPLSDGAPVNLTAPEITGAPELDAVLSVAPGSWYGRPAPALTHQWMRDGSPIAGATDSGYTVVEDDEGADLTVVETAMSAAGAASATSDAVAVISGISDIADLWADDENGTLLDFTRTAGLRRSINSASFLLGAISNGQDLRFCEDGRFGYARGSELIDPNLSSYTPTNCSWTDHGDGTHSINAGSGGNISVSFGDLAAAGEWVHAEFTLDAITASRTVTFAIDGTGGTGTNFNAAPRSRDMLGSGSLGTGVLTMGKSGTWNMGDTARFSRVSAVKLIGQTPGYHASGSAGSGATYSASAPHAVFGAGHLQIALPVGTYTIGLAKTSGAEITAGVVVSDAGGYRLDESCSAFVAVGRGLSAAETAFLTVWLRDKAGLS